MRGQQRRCVTLGQVGIPKAEILMSDAVTCNGPGASQSVCPADQHLRRTHCQLSAQSMALLVSPGEALFMTSNPSRACHRRTGARDGSAWACHVGCRGRAGVYKSDIFRMRWRRSDGWHVASHACLARKGIPTEGAAAVEQALFEPNPKHRSGWSENTGRGIPDNCTDRKARELRKTAYRMIGDTLGQDLDRPLPA